MQILVSSSSYLLLKVRIDAAALEKGEYLALARRYSGKLRGLYCKQGREAEAQLYFLCTLRTAK